MEKDKKLFIERIFEEDESNFKEDESNSELEQWDIQKWDTQKKWNKIVDAKIAKIKKAIRDL